MKTDAIKAVIDSWWSGVDAEGKPLEIWSRLDRNHYRPDLDHVRAMIAAEAARVDHALHSVQVEMVGTTEGDSEIVVTIHLECSSPWITGDGPTRPGGSAPPTIVRWRPPAASDADRRTIMDVRYLGRAHSRHMRERLETEASILEARRRAEAAERERAAKLDRSLRASLEDAE